MARKKPRTPLSVSMRPDGRFTSTGSFVQHYLKTLRPELAFDPSLTREGHARWRKKVRSRLLQLMAFPTQVRQPAPRLLRQEPREGYTLQRWEIYPEPDSALPVLLLVPDGATSRCRAPAAICCPGSDYPKELLAGEPCPPGTWDRFGKHEHMAKHLAQRGFVTLAIDNPATGELGDPRLQPWDRQVMPWIWLGRSYESVSVFHKLRALAWLKTLPFVDPARIVASGHSLGAKPSLILGLLDSSIRAVVWNDHAASWRRLSSVIYGQPFAGWHYIPGMIRWFDYTDLMAALAPTPLLISEGGRGEDYRLIRRAYTIAGAEKQLKITFMPNFTRVADRKFDRKPIPEGIESKAYLKYCNLDDDHYFKDEVAVPWLCSVVGLPTPQGSKQ